MEQSYFAFFSVFPIVYEPSATLFVYEDLYSLKTKLTDGVTSAKFEWIHLWTKFGRIFTRAEANDLFLCIPRISTRQLQ